MQKRNCFTSLLCAALFLFVLVQCNALAESAALWPRLVCCVGLGLAGLEILVEGIQWARHPGEQQGLWALTPEQTKRSAILLGLLLLWIAGLTTIGFLVSSVAALCAIALVFEPVKNKQNLVRDIVVCVIFGVAFYFLFKFLGIHFPRTLLM